MNGVRWLVSLWIIVGSSVVAAERSLVVVQDSGGQSALPYYRALRLSDPQTHRPQVNSSSNPPPPIVSYREADMLPVRSARLRPGHVSPRMMHAPVSTPIFLIGDDAQSRTWLEQRSQTLLQLGAIGFVVNVESGSVLRELRMLAPGLKLIPAPGDDVAQRLDLRHYPVLITAAGIEQ